MVLSRTQEFTPEEVTTDGPRATTDSGDYVIDLEGHARSESSMFYGKCFLLL